MEGYSSAAIMDATGFTIGQVSGFARRAGLVMRKIQAAKKNKALPPVPVVKIEHRERVHIEPIPVRQKHPTDNRVGSENPVTIMELTMNHCRWMLDDKHYCGAVTIIKNRKIQSYCKGHYAIMYQPANKVYK
jgi:hypothetical protein